MIASVELSAQFRHSPELPQWKQIIVSPSLSSNGHAVLMLAIRYQDGFYEVDADEFERAVRAMRILADREVFLYGHNKA